MEASSPLGNEDAESVTHGALDGMRPCFRQDALFAESEEGVYLQRPGDEFVLKGRSVYRWMVSLAPRMNGEYTVEQLGSGLPDGHRKTLVSLITLLIERGYVHVDRPEVASRSAPDVRYRFSRQIEYVAHFASTEGTTFDAFRESRFLLIGASDLVTAVGTGLLRNGAENVDIAQHSPAAFEKLNEEAGQLRASGCPCSVRERQIDDYGTGAIEEYDLVVAAGSDVRELLRLNEIAYAGGPQLLPLLVLGNRAIVGPLVGASTGPCLQCALLRQSGARLPAESMQLWRSAALGDVGRGEHCSPGLARMLGMMLAFEAFRLRTGVLPAETERALIMQNLETAESERAPLLAHPLCPLCSGAAGDGVAKPAHDGPADYDALFGAEGGILNGYHDVELTQSPLRVGRVGLASVDGPYGTHREITAFDLETVDDARRRAVRVAATCYAEELAGRGDAFTDMPAQQDREIVRADQLSIHGGSRSSCASPLVLGRSIVDGKSCWLPSAAVYARSWRNNARVFEATSAGAVCGESLDEAEREGLLSALGFDGLCAALRGQQPAEEVDLGRDTDGLDFLLQIAGQLRRQVRILDLPGCAPGFGCVATVGDEAVWAIGTGYRKADAAAVALRNALGMLGLGEHGNSVDLGNPVLPELDIWQLPVVKPVAVRASTSHAQILDQLRARGHDAFAIDTTPRDLRGAGLVTVRVLLSGRGRGC